MTEVTDLMAIVSKVQSFTQAYFRCRDEKFKNSLEGMLDEIWENKILETFYREEHKKEDRDIVIDTGINYLKELRIDYNELCNYLDNFYGDGFFMLCFFIHFELNKDN